MKGFDTKLLMDIYECGWIEKVVFHIKLQSGETFQLPGEFQYRNEKTNISTFAVTINSKYFREGNYYCTFETWTNNQIHFHCTEFRHFLIGSFDYNRDI